MRLIALGKITSEICQDLVFSAKTNRTYRSHALEEMPLKNNAELMHNAMQHQVVELIPGGVNTIQKHCSMHETRRPYHALCKAEKASKWLR